MRRIAFATLGCKSNQYDTECMIDLCRRAGFEIVSFDEVADAYVINTCTVTALADAQGRNLIRRARRRAPDAKVIAVGCSSQNDAKTYQEMPGVDEVLGVRCAEELVRFLMENFASQLVVSSNRVPVNQPRARALLKIQDGCNKRCTYCAVWRARGPSTSVDVDTVLSGYRSLSHYPEVMLTGIHIGQYGIDLQPRFTLWQLMERLMAQSGSRIRLGSLDPDEFEDRLVEILRSGRLCRHVHLSVQSCSDRILSKMGRGYSRHDVGRAIGSLYESIPGIGIGTDLITGFPGETIEDHRETARFLEEVPISFVHVFPYSARPGTKAAGMPDQIARVERKRRAKELIDIGRIKRKRFIDTQLGSEVDAVVTSRGSDEDGTMRAVTDNYITVRGPFKSGWYGKPIRARIDSRRGEEVYATWA